MQRTAHVDAHPLELTDAELAGAVHAQCERALRRLKVLARERDDVLLSQAVRFVWRAAELSGARMAEGEGSRGRAAPAG